MDDYGHGIWHWEVHMSHIYLEQESLLKNIPEILDGQQKTMLYVGASQIRAYLYEEFINYGYIIDILEIYPPNVDFLLKKGLNVTQGDVTNLHSIVTKKYDVIFWWHGPEHIKKEKLSETLTGLELHGNLIILGCPCDEKFVQGEVYGNINECHLWNPQPVDFENLGYKTCRINRIPDSDHITSWKHVR